MADKCAVGLSTAVPHTPRARGEGGEVGGAFFRLNGALVCPERAVQYPRPSLLLRTPDAVCGRAVAVG